MSGGSSIRLLHIFPSLARGGQQMRLAALVRALGPEFNHHIISLDGDISARAAFEECEVAIDVFLARKSAAISLTNIGGLRAIIRSVRPEILCTYNYGSLEAAFANQFELGAAHIHHEDGFGADEAIRQKLRRVWLRRLALRKSVVVAPSRTLETRALKVWRLSRRRVRRIPNGVDIAKFSDARRSANEEKIIIGSMGALRPEKNYGRLIRAFGAVAGRAEARLVIYGDGPERERLQAIAHSLGGAVEFRGATDRPEAAYASFDVFALSSDTEQAPLSLIEAMATGLPVVATDVGDIKDMLSVENTPFVAAVGDDAAYAALLLRLAQDIELRRRLGDANAKKARTEFNLNAMVGAYRALYFEALDRGSL